MYAQNNIMRYAKCDRKETEQNLIELECCENSHVVIR